MKKSSWVCSQGACVNRTMHGGRGLLDGYWNKTGSNGRSSRSSRGESENTGWGYSSEGFSLHSKDCYHTVAVVVVVKVVVASRDSKRKTVPYYCTTIARNKKGW